MHDAIPRLLTSWRLSSPNRPRLDPSTMMSSSTMIYYSRLRTLTLTGAILTVATAFPSGGWAQQSARVDSGKATTEPDSVAAIDGLYRKELDDIERRRLERLAALAGRQSGNEANQTYALYFRAAIAANLFAEAGPCRRARVAVEGDLLDGDAARRRGQDHGGGRPRGLRAVARKSHLGHRGSSRGPRRAAQ